MLFWNWLAALTEQSWGDARMLLIVLWRRRFSMPIDRYVFFSYGLIREIGSFLMAWETLRALIWNSLGFSHEPTISPVSYCFSVKGASVAKFRFPN